MSDKGMSQTEYLDRARKLRDTAAEIRERRVVEALISSAELYERLAAWLVEAGEYGSASARFAQLRRNRWGIARALRLQS